MYTNLLLFLVAIFLFSIDAVPDATQLPWWQALLLGGLFLAVYGRISVKLFSRSSALQSSEYFHTEKQLSIAALCFFGATLYLCDLKYYLTLIFFGETMPALVNIAGLSFFMLYLSIMWRAGRKNYERIFGRRYSVSSFIISNVKANLPIVLPWVVLSLLYDVVAILPFPGVQDLFASEWGDVLFFGIFLIFVIVFFPPLVRRLWGCKRLPDGYLKEYLDTFCLQQKFSANFFLWPLFEGRVLTAGVMGIVPGLRYILLTPALIETMSRSEIEAIMAHEIGHVKKYHLLLYLFLIAGFSLIAGMVTEPLLYLLFSLDSVAHLIVTSGVTVETALTVTGGVLLLVFMLVYFRYIFGYFIRNFERQADLFSLAAIGNCQAMVSAFEKIAVLSGNIRDQPNWHHFGIGERIDCLEKAEREPVRISRHNKKVWLSLLTYIAVVSACVLFVRQLPTEELAVRYQENLVEAVLLQKAKAEPDQALWQRLIGDHMLAKKQERKALAAYEKALGIDSMSPELMNNLAWLLLTSEDLSLRDPLKALTLARAAVVLQPKGYILDTLATAYWANALTDEAVRIGRQAALADPERRRTYAERVAMFLSQSYEESLQQMDVRQDENVK